MKKYFVLSISFIIISVSTFAQTFEIRTYLDDYDYIAVQLRQTALGSQTNTLSNTDSDGISDLTFTLTWAQSLGDVDVDLICSNYNIIESGTRTAKETLYYQQFGASVAFVCPDNYVLNEWVTIATIASTLTGSNSGAFELAADGWAGSLYVSIDWDGVGSSTAYYPTLVTGACNSTPIPTTVYDYVWTGASNTQWDGTSNWLTECGSAVASAPNTGNNCIIPSGLSNYPNEVNLAQFGGHQPTCTNLKINAGASLTLDEKDVTSLDLTWTFENIIIDGVLTSIPKTSLTVTGTTIINSANGIIIQADATGVGSFIDNGTITYGASGTAKVQTYLSNSAGSGNFDIHTIGTTVDMIGGGAGANLSAFNLVNGNTFAYEWDEGVVSTSGWTNIYDNAYVVAPGAGIGLSTDDGSTNTLEMTGELLTGSISSPTLAFTNNHNELISNPYPSAIDFDGLASDNTAVVQDKYWIWDPAGDVYVARAAGAGGSQYIQVGQGFFVETKQGGTFDFTNARRAHSNDAFRNTMANILTVKAVGGVEGYKDEMIVRFDDNATSGYDIEIEAEKWLSQNNDATQIWAIAEDNTELAIEVLPTASLLSGMTSIPMHFSCGYNTEYTISFYDMETFEIGTEIWLEDKQTGGDWISVNDNPDYTFTATPDDLEDRFVIHFFGTTGVDEFEIENTVDIFSYRQNAFVRNNTNEVIKTVSIYTLAGELLQNSEPANIKLNKFWVSNSIGYYVVRVITNQNVYTKKVFISK